MTLPPARRGPGWPLLAVLGIGVVLIAAALLTFANPLGGSDSEKASRYIEVVVGSPSKINPLFVHLNDVDRDISSLVFSGLVALDKDGTPRSGLAESWEVEDGGRQVTFHLRSGVKWHTGAIFTAQDVIFTYDLLADPALQGDPEQSALWQSIECTAPDDLTVTCVLPEPYAPFITYATVGIVPRHILEAATAASIFEDPFNRAPVGTGPFRLSQLDSSHALLKANADYYLGEPGLDEIELRFHGDLATAAADLVRGEADGLLVDLSVNPADLQTLRSVERLTEHSASRSAYTVLYLNDTQAPLNDPAVRTAIAHALDIASIITGLLAGRGERAPTPIPPGTWAFDGGLDPPSHDIGRARNILDTAGWVLDPDTAVRHKDGTELRFTLVTDQDALRGAIADAVSEQLATAGIDVSVVRHPSNDLVRDYLLPREYQAAIFGWDPGADPDPYPAWHSSQAIDNGRNIAGYASDSADDIMEGARRTNDLSERVELYGEFQALFLEDVPSVLLFVPLYTYFVTDQVQGIDVGVLFNNASRFRNVHEWRFEDAGGIGG